MYESVKLFLMIMGATCLGVCCYNVLDALVLWRFFQWRESRIKCDVCGGRVGEDGPFHLRSHWGTIVVCYGCAEESWEHSCREEECIDPDWEKGL